MLEQRVRELEADLASARAAEASERERRLAAQASRDQWVSIARGEGLAPEHAQLFGDPALAINAAHAAEARARRLAEDLQRAVLQRDALLGGLARVVRALPKLPAPVARLHLDAVSALRWAFSDTASARHSLLDQGVQVPPSVLAELDKVAEQWEAIRSYSMAKVAGDHTSAEAAKAQAGLS